MDLKRVATIRIGQCGQYLVSASVAPGGTPASGDLVWKIAKQHSLSKVSETRSQLAYLQIEHHNACSDTERTCLHF